MGDASPRRLTTICNRPPSFYVNELIQVTDDDQPISTIGPDQTAFAIDDDLEPTADEEPQLGLNEKEAENENEQQRFEPIQRKEFIRELAKDLDCREYAK